MPDYSEFASGLRPFKGGKKGHFSGPVGVSQIFVNSQVRRAASVTSAWVVGAPKLNRNDPSTSDFEQPIASSVGDGSLDPLAQAEPVEHATPARSNAIIKACRSRPGKATFEVCGKRGTFEP